MTHGAHRGYTLTVKVTYLVPKAHVDDGGEEDELRLWPKTGYCFVGYTRSASQSLAACSSPLSPVASLPTAVE